jgi:DNA-binding GntR family transcriptional regulator
MQKANDGDDYADSNLRTGIDSGRPIVKKVGIDHTSLDQKAYNQIKSMIIDQNLKPGSKIYQEMLAENLGISRTPLVNALKKLEQEHLIIAIPRRGFYTRHFSKEEMINIFELREVLEGLAARRAAIRISDNQIQKLGKYFRNFKTFQDDGIVEKYAKEDRRFHDFLINIGGDDLMSNILETYNVITFSYLVKFRGGLVRPPQETLPEHLAIIKAIVKKDPEMAEQAVRLHFKRSQEKLIKEFERESQIVSQSHGPDATSGISERR